MLHPVGAAPLQHRSVCQPYRPLRRGHRNLARRSQGNLALVAGGDRDGARDILGGICDIAVANSYYVGLMRSGKGGEEQVQWGEAIRWSTDLP